MREASRFLREVSFPIQRTACVEIDGGNSDSSLPSPKEASGPIILFQDSGEKIEQEYNVCHAKFLKESKL